MRKIFKMGAAFKRIMALALAFVLVLGYIPAEVSAEEATKTVYVGVIEWITDYVPEIHYWNNSGLADDVVLTSTGKTVSAYAGDGYWSDNQIFHVYTAEVPAAATNMKTWDQDTNGYWAAEDEICQSNKMLLLFEWGGIHHNTTIDCPHPVHGTDGNCVACGASVGHSYDSTGNCSCGASCSHSSHGTDGNCVACGTSVGHSYDSTGNCSCGLQADAHTHNYGTTGTCSCGANAVACTILDGTTTYFADMESLRQTLQPEMSGCTVKLLQNVAVNYFGAPDDRCGFYLDLNGHTLTATDCVSLPGSSGCTIMDTSAEKNGKIVGTVYAAYSTALTGGTIEGTVSFPQKASATGYTFQMEGGAIHADMDFGINDNNTTIVLTGGTFPGGISIACGDNVTTPMTLADCISGSYKYFQNGSVVTLTEGQTEITGGDVTVAAYVAHTHTYTNGFCESVEGETHYEPAQLNADGVYEIGNAGQLYWFADKVNNDNANFGAAGAVLTADITVNEGQVSETGTYRDWTPIGYVTDDNYIDYTGTFDGNGKTVSGLYFNDENADNVGLIGYLDEGGSVKNVTVANSYFQGKNKVGGVVGSTWDSAGVTGCRSSATVAGNEKVGGIVGGNYGTPITDCHNTGSVSGYDRVGGITGYNTNNNVMSLCSNTGSVSGHDYVGGIVGDNDMAEVTNCYNTGSVSGSSYVGGIAGYNNYKAAVANCYNTGSVSGSSYVGGVNGRQDSFAQTTGCYYLTGTATGGINGGDVEGSAEVKTDYQFTSGQVTYLLNNKSSADTVVWKQTLNGTNYPTFTGDIVYYAVVDCVGNKDYSNSSGDQLTHNYDENGFCVNEAEGVVCDAYEPAVPVTEDNYTELGLTADYVGYYAITNAGQLYWFADKVDNDNENFGSANAVLTADVIITPKPASTRYWNPIGSADAKYSGIFDGNGKTIDGICAVDETADHVGLVAWLTEDGVVKNVAVTGDILWGNDTVGAIVAYNEGTVELCGNTMTVRGKGIGVGGIVGVNAGTVRNCWNTGYVDGEDAGGIVGNNELGATVANCWSTGEIDGTNTGGIVGLHRTGATVENCYTTQATAIGTAEGTVSKVETKSADQFASGEVAYLLGSVWGQNIDNGQTPQTVPALSGTTVYKVVTDCLGSVGYSNTESTGTPSHNYVNGFCANEAEGVVCDAYEPAVKVTNDNYTALGLTADYVDYYAISNAGQLYWFADKVDNENDTYKTANVVLTADITVNTGTMDANTTGAREWNPIGYWVSGRDYAAFNGTFDGNNKKISGLYFNNTESTTGRKVALIAEAESGALVKNVTVTNTWFHGYDQVAGIVGDNAGTITGCVSEASLSCTWSYIGGVAGWNEGTITGCINRGTIVGKYNNSGGIAGHNAGTVELCGNEGNISNDWCYAGGIAGNNAGIVRNCWNTGEIYVTNSIAGGIAGMNNPDDLVENCWSTGAVSCGSDPESAGGIVGQSEDATQRNCYSLMDPVGMIEDDGGVSTVENMDQITLEQLASGEVAYLLRIRAAEGTDVWGQNIDNGETVQTVPALNGADVYYGYFDCASTEAKLTNTAVSATPVAHDYDNGFCTNELADGTVCDAYEPAVLVTVDNYTQLGLTADYVGYYAISNAGQLYWFADKVDNENDTYKTANVVLTADVTVNEGTVTASSTGMRDWNPIGWFSTTSDDRAAFSGTFDGNGKRVSGLYFNNIDISGVSLVAITGETALVKNVTVTNSYFCVGYNSSAVVAINLGTVSGCFNEATLSGESQIAGIVGRNLGLVELCGNTGAIAGRSSYVGGIVGDNKSTVRNCWNTGNIQAGLNYVGGITGANNCSDGAVALTENCWSTGTVVSFNNSGSVGGIVGAAWWNRGGVRNCYSLVKPVGRIRNSHPVTNAEAVTLDQFASGEVAYLLRIHAAEGTDVWGQNIDNDQTKQDVPALNGADVYQVVLDCAGSLGYSNTNASKAVHNYDDNGFCTNENAEGGLCDAYEPAVPVTEDNYTELDLTADYVDYYAISNAGQLYWFADKVDNEHDTYGSVNVVLTKNITVNEGQITSESTGMRQWIPTGDRDHQYGGTFDGNGKTISGLYYNDNGNNSRYVALISCMAESGVVKNVTVTNSVFIGYEFTAAIVGYNYGTVTGCVNNAPISGATYSAGIAADNRGTVELCGNTGTVHASWAVSGGIVARSLSSGEEDAAVVGNCWNTGSISSENKIAGGIVGESSAQANFNAYARVRNCWSTGSVSAPEAAGGVTGRNWRAAVSNCYSLMAPEGVLEQGAYTDKAEQKTLEQFASGEVAYLLGGVWGQDLDNGKTPQTVPSFDGADVYQITVDCAGNIGYSNTDADKVPHALTHVPAVAATCTEEGNIEHWSCVCGKFFAEEACTTELPAEDISIQPTGHTYGTEGTCTNINNGVVCGHGAGASLTTKTGGTKFFDTLQEALDAAKTTVAADEAVVKVLKDVVNTDKISAVNAKGGVFTLDVGDAKLVGDDYGLSVENATVTITGNTGYIDCIYGLYSDLIIDGVTVKAQQSDSTAISMDYCNLTVKSGSVINNKYAGYAILSYGPDAEVLMEGGTISATGNTGKGIALMGGATVSVTGGTINAVQDIITMDGLCSLSGVLAGGSFPGGLYLKEDYREPNMNEVLADGFAYWQQDVQVDVDDDAESIQGDVEVKSNCKHPSITYSASGYVLTADCDTCSAASALELIPQTDAEKIYSGTEKSAAYTGSILGLDTVPVTYTGDRVNVGSFTASVTVGGAAVEMPMEIVPYELEVKTFTLVDKVYDGTNTCAVTSLSFVSTANGEELVLGTDFTAQLTFPAADAGDYTDAVLAVELMPTAPASNYILKSDTVTGISHSIDPATITVTDVKVADKVYDGTTDATVTSVTASGIVAGDDVKVEVQAAFADKNSGTDKPVNLTYTLSGADAGNYVLAEETGRTTTSITVKPLEEIVEPVKDLSVDNVTSDDKETLEDVKEELEFVLTDEGLSDEQRKEREDALQDVQDMLDRIQDAADAITTDPIMDTKDITADNITLDDREDVEQALEDLYGALEDYENNYTDAEKEGIHDDIERLEAALAALKQVEDLIKDIEELPDEVQPDTDLRDDILDTKDRYDELDDHQKDLVPEEILQKLNDLLADLKVYLIIEGDDQTWTDGDLSFTANGPFDLFMELKIDGSTVAASNYTAVSGSTVLTLKESYVETLTAGKHSIKFVYPDGEAVGSFTVEIPTNGSATTGDEAPILLLAVMMSVSLAGALMLLERKRKV